MILAIICELIGLYCFWLFLAFLSLENEEWDYLKKCDNPGVEMKKIISLKNKWYL